MSDSKDSLSERELEILRLVATGAANKEIARQLVISPNTVKVHLRNIFAKIGVASRTEATLYAMKIGLVPAVAVQGEPSSDTIRDTEMPGEEGRGLVEPQPVPTPRVWKTWQISLALLAVLALVTISVTGLRLLNPFAPAPTTAAQATLSAGLATRWTGKAGLPAPRKGMGAVAYENAFYLIAGQTPAGLDGATLRYRIAENAWETLASKPTAVTDIQAALLGEKIYVPGGCLADGSPIGVMEVYDPRQNSWEAKAPLPEPVCAYALATYEGQLYLFGGKRDGNYLSTVYLYDPQEDRWQERQPMSTPRAYAGAVEVSGKILVIGGYDGQQALSLNEASFPNREDAGEQAWETYAPIPESRYAMGITQLAGLVYLVGGLGDQGSSGEMASLQYHPQADEWFQFESAPEPAGAYPSVLSSGSFLYILGGETQAGLSAYHQSYQAIYTISVPIISGED